MPTIREGFTLPTKGTNKGNQRRDAPASPWLPLLFPAAPPSPHGTLEMPAFQAATGTDEEQRDARGPHPLVFGAGDSADEFRMLAPGICAGGDGTPVMVGYGQLASLLLCSLVRVPETGGPAAGTTLGLYRCSDTALHRLWHTLYKKYN